MLDIVALEQTADSNPGAARLKDHRVGSVAVVGVKLQSACLHGLARLLDGAHATITDIADESRIVPYGQHKIRVVEREATQRETLGIQAPAPDPARVEELLLASARRLVDLDRVVRIRELRPEQLAEHRDIVASHR